MHWNSLRGREKETARYVRTSLGPSRYIIAGDRDFVNDGIDPDGNIKSRGSSAVVDRWRRRWYCND